MLPRRALRWPGAASITTTLGATRDFHHGLLDFFDRPDLPAPVEPTVRTDLMGRFPLVTLRALAEHDRVEAVMRAPLGGAGLGVPSFGISHDRYRVLSCLVRGDAAPRTGTTVGCASLAGRVVSSAAVPRPTLAAYWFNRPFSPASLGSPHRATHSHAVVFRLPPHTAQSPRQSARQSGFIGNAS